MKRVVLATVTATLLLAGWSVPADALSQLTILPGTVLQAGNSVTVEWRGARATSAITVRQCARDGQDTTPPTKPTFLPVQVAATTDVQITFPNGATLTLPVDDHELIKLSIVAIAQARTTTTRTLCGEA